MEIHSFQLFNFFYFYLYYLKNGCFQNLLLFIKLFKYYYGYDIKFLFFFIYIFLFVTLILLNNFNYVLLFILFHSIFHALNTTMINIFQNTK